MSPLTEAIDFLDLVAPLSTNTFLQQLTEQVVMDTPYFMTDQRLACLKRQWHELSNNDMADNDYIVDDDARVTAWLIRLFNELFFEQHVVLTHSQGEPEYYPAKGAEAAKIAFAHGFLSSALHEISHWCMAGRSRRRRPDFGYWYAPDGRSAIQQRAFEQVEIKPQALECLFTIACGRSFHVSQDNLFADFDTSHSTFSKDVYQQATHYIAQPHLLPRDARALLLALLTAASFACD